ncbi:unnamed protein product [Prunus armeniaca]
MGSRRAVELGACYLYNYYFDISFCLYNIWPSTPKPIQAKERESHIDKTQKEGTLPSLTYKRRLISFKEKRELDRLLGHHMAHKSLMGLLLSPFTSPRIICLQPDPQPSALHLQPSAFGHQPSTLSLRPSASGILPPLLGSNSMCNVYSLYHNENILLRGRSPLFG